MKKILKICAIALLSSEAAVGMLSGMSSSQKNTFSKLQANASNIKQAFEEIYKVDFDKDILLEEIVRSTDDGGLSNLETKLGASDIKQLKSSISLLLSKNIASNITEKLLNKQIEDKKAELNSIKAEILKTKGTIKNMGDIAEETSKVLNSFTNDDSLANRSEDSSLITELVNLLENLKSSCDEDTDLSKSYSTLKLQSARNLNNDGATDSNDDNSNSLNGIGINALIQGSAQKVDDQKNSLETFFARMEDVLREVERNEQQLRAEIARLNSRNSNLSTANQDQTAELERQTAELESLRAALSQKELNKNELEAERQNLQEKVNKLNVDMDGLKTDATAKGAENNELKINLNKLNSEKQAAEQEIVKLNGRIFSFNADIKEISEKLARKKAKSKDRKRQLGDASAQIEQLKQNISILENDKYNLEKEYKKSQIEIKQLREEKNETEKSIADYQNLVAKLRNDLATIGNVGAANALLAKDNALMKNKLANLNAEISVLNGRNDKAKKKDAELQLNQEKMKNKLANLDVEILALNRRNDRAKKTDAELQLNQEKLTEYEQEIVAANFRRDIEYVLNELIYDAEFIDKSKPKSDKIIDGNCNLAEFSKIKSIISRLWSENRQWNSSSFMERLDKIFGKNFEIFDGDLAWIINKSTLVIAGLRRDYRQGRVSGNSIRRQDLTKLKVYTRS